MSYADARNTATPLAYSLAQTAELIGLSLGLVRKLVASGELRHRKAGARTLIPRTAIEEYLEGSKGDCKVVLG